MTVMFHRFHTPILDPLGTAWGRHFWILHRVSPDPGCDNLVPPQSPPISPT
jgi:hypothetical protein